MSYNNGPKIITNNLALYLDAASKKSYPGTGTTVYDLSRNGNTSGFAGAGVTYTTINGGEFYFDGTSTAYIGVGACTRYLPAPQFTLETWVKSSGLGSGMTRGGLFGITYGIIVHIESNGALSFYNYNTDSGYPGNYDIAYTTSDVNLFDNVWHHVVCVRDVSTYQVYIDTVRKASAAVSYPNWSGTNIWSSMDGNLGNNPNDAYYRLKGYLALPKIYKQALTSNDVIRNYNATKGRFRL